MHLVDGAGKHMDVKQGSKDPGCHCLKKGRNLGGTIAFRRNQAGSHTNST